LLGDAGCLDDRWATDKTAVAGTDPLQVIIDRAADADGFSVINEAEVSARRQALAASGLTETSSWQALSTLDNHRGAVGEALRMSDLAAEHPGKTLQQGVILARQPHGLDFVETKDQALDWCETFGVNPRKLSSWVDDGQRRFGIQVSEIDVCVFEEVSGALHPRVFENVKAGNGTAGTADKQNRRALEAIVEPDMKILFHEDGEAYRDRTADVARSADVIAEVQIATVGPLGDPTYDVSLPLTASDITELTHRLRGER